jgi:hypothetical protein
MKPSGDGWLLSHQRGVGGAEVMNTNMYDKAIACRYRYFSCNDVSAIHSISEKKADDGLIQYSRSPLFPRRSK